jgi:hypothetical protein
VPDRPDVAVRLVPLKLRLRHVTALDASKLERVKGIEPSS